MRSSAAEGLAAEDILYREGNVTVMPSWLEVDGRESYAVRSIVRLSLSRNAPPRAVAGAVLAVALTLVGYAGWLVLAGALPFLAAWLLLALSVALALVAGHVALVRPTEHVLDVRFVDGTPVRLVRDDRAALLALHRALSHAMERQRGS